MLSSLHELRDHQRTVVEAVFAMPPDASAFLPPVRLDAGSSVAVLCGFDPADRATRDALRERLEPRAAARPCPRIIAHTGPETNG